MRVLKQSSLEAYLFALVGIAAAAFPMTWYFRSLLVLIMAGIIVDLIIRSPWTANWQWRPKLFCIVTAFCLLGAAAWRPIADDYRGAELPEGGLRFVHPELPMLVLDNNSSAIARDIKKMVGIWNADDLRTYVAGSSGDDPLPIPVSTFDMLRPHTSSGPESLFQPSVNAGYIKPGNRLIGSIGVICPTCSRGHTYVVYIVWGKEGWYAEVPQYNDKQLNEGQVVVPRRITKENLDQFFKSIEQTPKSERHQIKEVE